MHFSGPTAPGPQTHKFRDPPHMITLQNFIFPEPTICTEHDLYYRAYGDFGFSQGRHEVSLGRGARLTFDTYFNMLSIGKWQEACILEGLFAEISGQGKVEVRVFQAIPDRSWEVLHVEVATLTPETPHLADLSHFADHADTGVIYVEIKSLEKDVTISGGRFTTNTQPVELPELAVSITTFKREKEVRRTVQRFEAFLPGFEFGDHVHVQVVDNGHSAEIEASKSVTPMTNHNYGGAGGFARGLLEAEKSGYSHCLFMDDDASFHLENIARTYVFLALAKDRRAAVSGAMITNTHKWAMWENGAFFDGSCHPLFCGVDLRDRDAVMAMEHESARLNPPTLYGGWWFFAFAIDQVKHHPFPFFVRGDDISFSLANDFAITTLNGVVSFQDDFTEKESAQTLYLDLRNHLIHHMVFDTIDRSALGTGRIAVRFIMRSLLRFHYESAAAQLLAWQDVMQGPEFFDKNIDMAERRGSIKDMLHDEVWQDVNPEEIKERRKYTHRPPEKRHRLGVWTLNGHLMPLSAQRWDRIVLSIGDRPAPFPAFGASQITYLNTARNKGYTVTQSKRRFFSVCWQMTTTLVRFVLGYSDLKAAYRQGYDQMTTRDYWEKTLAAE
ncbi:MAG: galactofuranosylgalactofuranosylrhamnosyl-N-acetylglucosaminyl-diphospho-decaprenol beta-1,5 [Paracoccaceae bacterium]